MNLDEIILGGIDDYKKEIPVQYKELHPDALEEVWGIDTISRAVSDTDETYTEKIQTRIKTLSRYRENWEKKVQKVQKI